MILSNRKLKGSVVPARTLTFVECSRLSIADLQITLLDFPQDRHRVRMAASWMALRRWCLWSLEEVCKMLNMFRRMRKAQIDILTPFQALKKPTVSTVCAQLR